MKASYRNGHVIIIVVPIKGVKNTMHIDIILYTQGEIKTKFVIISYEKCACYYVIVLNGI